MPLLDMKEICKSFFGRIVLDHVDFSVEKGEIHALLGENGAGKTTLMNVLFGLYHADSGKILWQGEPSTFSEPLDAHTAGIGMVHQHLSLVQTMTVQQNISLGLKSKGYPFLSIADESKKIEKIAKKYDFDVAPQAVVNTLSLGEQQRVEILRALYRNAKLLILDEPTAVLTPSETESFFKILERLKAEGHSIVLITHRMSEIMRISDRVTILRNGKKISTLTTKNTNPDELSRLMIGSQRTSPVAKKNVDNKRKLLTLENVSVKENDFITLNNINFSLKSGEILGIAGIDGNGQTQLAESIIGVQKSANGCIHLNDIDITNLTVKERRELGIAYVPSDRHQDGLALDLCLLENLMVNKYKDNPFYSKGLVKWNLAQKYSQNLIDKYNIKNQGLTRPVRLLSGGNQQKIILAREIDVQPEVLIVYQPTRGLDIGATQQVRNLLLSERNSGRGIILISADLDEVLSLSDRVAVLFCGELMGILEGQNGFDVELIGAMMGGKSIVQTNR